MYEKSIRQSALQVNSSRRFFRSFFCSFHCAPHQLTPGKRNGGGRAYQTHALILATMSRPPSHSDESPLTDLYEHPGHLLRRAQQISVSIFHDEIGGVVTPVQYAILRMLSNHPGIDQVTLAGLVAIDTSTGATVCARLEEKGLLLREVIPHNRRQRALRTTAAGEALLEELTPGLQRLRKRLLAPLEEAEQRQFMALLDKLVQLNNPQSRAPLARLQDERCDED